MVPVSRGFLPQFPVPLTPWITPTRMRLGPMSATANKISAAEIRHRLESGWAQWAQRPVDDPPGAAALERLAREVVDLRDAGKGWATRDLANFGNESTWRGYCLEVHFEAALLQAGVDFRPNQRLLEENESDVDVVLNLADGKKCNIELVCIHEPDDMWTEETTSDGHTSRNAIWSWKEQTFAIRRVKGKLRQKTIRNGEAWKLADPGPNEFNLLVAETSSIWIDGSPRYWDCALMTWGTEAEAPEWYQGPVLGLFEATNSLGTEFDEEFINNVYFRERVHAILFLNDTSRWWSPLDPRYYGTLFGNHLLTPNLAGRDRLTAMVHSSFHCLLEAWREPGAGAKALRELHSIAEQAGVAYEAE